MATITIGMPQSLPKGQGVYCHYKNLKMWINEHMGVTSWGF